MVVGQFKIGAVIQARLGSTRLPNKVMMPLPFGSKQSIISHVINGIKKVSEITNITVATSRSLINDDLEAHVNTLKVDCYRGSEHDVLSRFYEIVKKYEFDYVIRFTADNPIIDCLLLKEFMRNFISNDLDYSYSNNLPIGCNFEMMKSTEIIQAYENTEDIFDKEHVTPYIKRSAKRIEYYTFKNIQLNNNLRLTIDYPSDYALMTMIYSILKNKPKSLKNILNIVEKNSWILNINKDNFQKKGFLNIKEEIQVIMPILEERELIRLKKVLDDYI